MSVFVAEELSEVLNTKVVIGRINMGLLNRIIIDDVLLDDQSGQEMLKVTRLSAKFDIMPFFKGKISISSVQLFGFNINLRKETPDSPPNFKFVLDAFASKDTVKKENSLDLRINSILIRRGRMSYHVLSEEETPGKFNAKHIQLQNIIANISLKALSKDSLNLGIKRLSLDEKASGFSLKKMSLKLLLITPHKRREIFWAKGMILLEITLIATGALFVASFLLCGILSGFSGIGDMQVLALFGQVVRLPYLLFVLLKYLLNLLPVLVYGALALMLSAVTRKGAVAIAVSIILYVGSSMVTTILLVLSGAGIIIPGMKFLFFCNTDLTGYLPGMNSMMNMGMPAGLKIDPSMTLGFSVVVLLVYLVCFLWIARDSFCRRDIK